MSQAYWAAYPWADARDKKDWYLVTLDSIPASWGKIPQADGSLIYVPAPVLWCYVLTIEGVEGRTPWAALDSFPAWVPQAKFDGKVSPDFRISPRENVQASFVFYEF